MGWAATVVDPKRDPDSQTGDYLDRLQTAVDVILFERAGEFKAEPLFDGRYLHHPGIPHEIHGVISGTARRSLEDLIQRKALEEAAQIFTAAGGEEATDGPLAGLEEQYRALIRKEAERFRVEQRPDFSVETTGFLLERKGLAFAPILALLEIQGVFFDRRFAGIVQTQAEKDRLLDTFTEITDVREILEQRLVVVADSPGATAEEQYRHAEVKARAHLFGLVPVLKVDRLLPDWVLQLNAMLKTVGYQLPEDPAVREAGRALLYAA